MSGVAAHDEFVDRISKRLSAMVKEEMERSSDDDEAREEPELSPV